MEELAIRFNSLITDHNYLVTNTIISLINQICNILKTKFNNTINSSHQISTLKRGHSILNFIESKIKRSNVEIIDEESLEIIRLNVTEYFLHFLKEIGEISNNSIPPQQYNSFLETIRQNCKYRNIDKIDNRWNRIPYTEWQSYKHESLDGGQHDWRYFTYQSDGNVQNYGANESDKIIAPNISYACKSQLTSDGRTPQERAGIVVDLDYSTEYKDNYQKNNKRSKLDFVINPPRDLRVFNRPLTDQVQTNYDTEYKDRYIFPDEKMVDRLQWLK
ncbi:hypothetical protein SNEBB_000439 [Seison nebaliae]|nr:hypothetical protein SNEBB_000439 [Seison nebaliae]